MRVAFRNTPINYALQAFTIGQRKTNSRFICSNLRSIQSSNALNYPHSAIDFTNGLIFSPIISNACRCSMASCLQIRGLSTVINNTSAAAASISTIIPPPNLILDDNKVIEPEPPKLFKKEEYLFPKLDSELPDSIPVMKFNSPGDRTDKEALIEKTIFGVAIRKDIVHDCIRYTRHKRRQPKKTKRLNEISGSKKKPWAQKGLGRAQVGNKRNSIWRGGQKAHGPVIRDYSINLNRKMRALGMMMTLTARYREGNLMIVDKLQCDSFRTKELNELLTKHGIADKTTVFIDVEFDENFLLAGRNLQKVESMLMTHMTVYEILRREKLVITQEAFSKIQTRLMNQYTHNGKRRAMETALQFLQDCQPSSTAAATP